MNNFTGKIFSLKGKVAIVTGASKGIGFSLARGLGQSGADVYGIARREKSSTLVNSFRYISCDVTDTNRLKKIIDEIYLETGHIDILVNCAGVSMSGSGSLETRERIFDKTFSVNVKSPFVIIDLVSNYMKKGNGGSIINITSIASEFGFAGNPSYVASKGALRMLTKAFAEDLSEYGIRVNNICPGYIHTEMTSKSYEDKDLYDIRLRNTMLKRWGSPEDLIGAAIFLSSDSSSYITGIDLKVDGGWTAKGMV